MARDEDFGARFGRLRKELSLSQADIARLMGMSQKSVSNFENGSFTPRSAALRRYENLYEAFRQATAELTADSETLAKSLQAEPQVAQRALAIGVNASPDIDEIEWFRTRVVALHRLRKSGERLDLGGQWETESETWLLARLRGEISRAAEHWKSRPSKPSPQVRAEFSRLAHYVEASQQLDSDCKHEVIRETRESKFESLQDLIISASKKIFPEAGSENAKPPFAARPESTEKQESFAETKSGRLQDILGQTFRDISITKPDLDRASTTSRDERLLNELDTQLGFLLPRGSWAIDRTGSFSQYSLVFDEGPTCKLDYALITRECERLQISPAYRRPLRVITEIDADRITIEIPHAFPKAISLRELVSTARISEDEYALPLSLGLGARGVWGEVVVAELVEMPNLLVAGSDEESTGKALIAITASLLATSAPQDLNVITSGTKESNYWSALHGTPHLEFSSPAGDDGIVEVLKWATNEMDQRHDLFEQFGVGTINSYNSIDLCKHASCQARQKLPYIVLLIDESGENYSKLTSEPISSNVARIARSGSVAGIHLIIAASPSSFAELSDAITSNVPARAVLRVDTPSQSRTLLGTPGAELLIDSRDLLYLSPVSSRMRRLQCADVSVSDLSRIRDYWLEQQVATNKANLPWRKP